MTIFFDLNITGFLLATTVGSIFFIGSYLYGEEMAVEEELDSKTQVSADLIYEALDTKMELLGQCEVLNDRANTLLNLHGSELVGEGLALIDQLLFRVSTILAKIDQLDLALSQVVLKDPGFPRGAEDYGLFFILVALTVLALFLAYKMIRGKMSIPPK